MKSLEKVLAAAAESGIPVIIALHPTEGIAVVVGSVEPERNPLESADFKRPDMVEGLQEMAIERGAACDVVVDAYQLGDAIYTMARNKYPESSFAQTPNLGESLPGHGEMPPSATVFSKGPKR